MPGYDYSQPGAYFITIVTQRRECLFGEVVGGEMRLNDAGRIVEEVWLSLPMRYPGVALGAAVVMPNHFHGIVEIFEMDADPVGATHEIQVNPGHPVGAIHELPHVHQAKDRQKGLILAR